MEEKLQTGEEKWRKERERIEERLRARMEIWRNDRSLEEENIEFGRT